MCGGGGVLIIEGGTSVLLKKLWLCYHKMSGGNLNIPSPPVQELYLNILNLGI